MECELHGVRMPELRSGARRSKRLDDLQPPQPVDQAENWVLPAQNRTRRRVGGRGRGNAAAVAKGPSPAVPTRPTAAGRGRGIRLIDLDPEPCQVLPEAAPLAAAEPALNRVEVVADKDIAMEGGSADKIMGVEEEASTTPVPERVTPYCLLYLSFFVEYIYLLLKSSVLSCLFWDTSLLARILAEFNFF